jgi:hypothetical protein
MSSLYAFELTGVMPLLLHQNNIDGRDELEEYQKSELGQKLAKKGDDRCPPWTWHYCLYHSDGMLVIPTDNIMAALLFGGMKTKIIGAKTGTYKELSQSGLFVMGEGCPLLVGGKPIASKNITRLHDMKYGEQRAEAAKLGIDLFTKPVTIGKSSWIRVRPRFNEWSLKGTIDILDELITFDALKLIFENTGKRAGLGDWRPGVLYPKRPGPYGTFSVKLKKA